MAAPTMPWADNFDDNSLSSDNWLESTHAGSLVVEQNQRLEVVSNASVSGYVRSLGSYVPKNTTLIVKVVQHCTDGGFKLCPTDAANHQWDMYNQSNWYNFQLIASTKLSPNVKDAGATAQVGGDSPTLSPPYWMRMRINDTTIYFDYADQDIEPTEGEWVNISSEVWDMGTDINQAQYVYLTGYNTPTTGQPWYDSFSWSAFTPAPSVSEALTITESVTVSVEALVSDLSVNVSDTLTTTESVTLAESTLGNISVNDTLTTTEGVTATNPDLGGISTNDTLTTSESLAIEEDHFDANVNDALALTENITTTGTLGEVSVSDSLEITEDVVSNSTTGEISGSDETVITEDIQTSGTIYLLKGLH